MKDGYIWSCLYNVEESKQVYCAKRIKFLDSSLIDTIDGIYKDCFYSILTPEYLDYAFSENPLEDYPDLFKTYDVEEIIRLLLLSGSSQIIEEHESQIKVDKN